MPPKPLILMIDDQSEPLARARRLVERKGYRVVVAKSARDAMVEIGSRSPHVILLALDAVEIDGLELIRRIREQTPTPIVILHCQGDEVRALDALELGADDYVCRAIDWSNPLAARELMARLSVALRVSARVAEQRFGEVVLGDIRIDIGARRVFLCAAEVHLTRTEYDLLVLLASNPGRAFAHDELLDRVWGFSHRGRHHNLRVYVNRIRKKLELDPGQPRYLQTVPGVGYRMVIPGSHEHPREPAEHPGTSTLVDELAAPED